MGRMGMGGGMMGMGGMGMGTGMDDAEPVTLMTVAYSGQSAKQAVPDSINPAAKRLDPARLTIAAERQLVLGMGHGRGYINGRDFDVKPYSFTSRLGTYEIWTISNPSGMDHPFHQHVNEAQVLSITGGDPGYAALLVQAPAWKDTLLVPAGGSVRMLVPVKDFAGMAMYHCHILEHEDIGMMGVWNIASEGEAGRSGEVHGSSTPSAHTH
jgi:FtsP/CotA-like multicopper oxidase with cupredoxin domain